jgi:hypothetical protein
MGRFIRIYWIDGSRFFKIFNAAILSMLSFMNQFQICFMRFYKSYLLFILLANLSFSCSFRTVQRSKEISYMENGFLGNLPEKQLNVFAPKKANGSNPVLFFIHGGSWDSGNKEIYNFLGPRLARKGRSTVV